ncbi:MAG: acetylxylan esterase, partial [Bacteroidetes bacterium]|nr:acetylxylan esterase [Bacteroidota bacterium]
MKNSLASLFICSFLFMFSFTDAQAQQEPAKVVAGIPVNYNEDSVGTYTLPDLFKTNDGKMVTTRQQWLKERRPEIVSLFEEYQYGKMPGRPADMHFVIKEKGSPAMDGKAIRKQVTVYFTKDTVHKMDLLIYLPAAAKKPVPLLQ